MSTTVNLAARRSDLARLQAYLVGAALEQAQPDLTIHYQFRAALGDQRPNEPLWQMPEKGVFTEDLRTDLLAGRCDLVVHSWKDLPIEDHPRTFCAKRGCLCESLKSKRVLAVCWGPASLNTGWWKWQPTV